MNVLSTIERRYVAICTDRVTSPLTLDDLATKYGISRRQIARALKWGEERNIYHDADAVRINNHIIDLQNKLAVLEREFERVAKGCAKLGKKQRWGLQTVLCGLAKYMLEYKTRIMELEGIYHQVVEHQGSLKIDLHEDVKIMVQEIIVTTGDGGANVS